MRRVEDKLGTVLDAWTVAPTSRIFRLIRIYCTHGKIGEARVGTGGLDGVHCLRGAWDLHRQVEL